MDRSRAFQLREQHTRRHRLVLAICFLSLLLFVCIIVALLLKYALGLDNSRNDAGADGLRLDGSWGDWLPWSPCSATCGGGLQSRRRFCDDPSPQNNGSHCDGVYDESRRCASWPCPDCSRFCEKGFLRKCAYCGCIGTSLRGRVSDMDSMPLYGVGVYLRAMQWEPVVSTTSLGTFSLSNVCKEELVLVLRKDGYRLAMVNATTLPDSGGYMSISLEKLRQPRLVSYPRDSVAFVGDRLTLSCMSDLPLRAKYEWYKNANILSHPNERPGMASFSTANAPQLVISDSQREDSGLYRCRTISDLGEKTFSEPAFINIIDAEEGDTCDPNPLPKIQSLPEGCESEDGSSSIDVGYCLSDICRRRTSNDDQDPKPGGKCCGVTLTETVKINCKQWSFPLAKAKTCGCILECGKTYKVPVTGRAILRDPAFETVKYISTTFIHEGEMISTDKDGHFLMTVFSNQTRTVLSIPPSTFPNSFTPDLRVLLHQPGSSPHFDILLKNRASSVRIDSSQSMEFPVMSAGVTSLPVGSVTLPGDRVMDASWRSYNGTMDVYTAFLDAGLKTDVEAAPGDFTYRNEEGEIYQLLIYGILIFYIEDPDGNDIKVNTDLLVSIDTSIINIPQGNVEWWTLDPETARWTPCNSKIVQQASRAQNGGSSPLKAIVEIHPDMQFLALAESLPNRDRCEVKVTVYNHENTTEPLIGQLVKILSKQKNTFVHKNEALTGLYGSVCVQVPCGCEHHLAVVESLPKHEQSNNLPFGLDYTISEDNLWLIFESPSASEITSLEGPIHRHGGHTCRATLSDSEAYQFVFVKNQVVSKPKKDVLNIQEQRPGFTNSWFEDPMDSRNISACALKFSLKGTPNDTEVIAVSKREGQSPGHYGSFITGTFDPMVDRPSGQEAEVCVLVRCPSVGGGGQEEEKEQEEGAGSLDVVPTHLDIHFTTQSSTECDIIKKASTSEVEFSEQTQTKNHSISLMISGQISQNSIGLFQSIGNGAATSDWALIECSKSHRSLFTLDCG